MFIITMAALSSCASTQQAGSKYNPDGYAYVFSNDIDPEPELKTAGVKYYCKKVIYSSTGLNKACYAEKSYVKKTSKLDDVLTKAPLAIAQVILGIGIEILIAFAPRSGNNYQN